VSNDEVALHFTGIIKSNIKMTVSSTACLGYCRELSSRIR